MFRFEWQKFKRVLQKSTEKRRMWDPVKLENKPFYSKLYRLECEENFRDLIAAPADAAAGCAGPRPARPASRIPATTKMRYDYLFKTLTTPCFISVPDNSAEAAEAHVEDEGAQARPLNRSLPILQGWAGRERAG